MVFENEGSIGTNWQLLSNAVKHEIRELENLLTELWPFVNIRRCPRTAGVRVRSVEQPSESQ
jgi:hypothetical protein